MQKLSGREVHGMVERIGKAKTALEQRVNKRKCDVRQCSEHNQWSKDAHL